MKAVQGKDYHTGLSQKLYIFANQCLAHGECCISARERNAMLGTDMPNVIFRKFSQLGSIILHSLLGMFPTP